MHILCGETVCHVGLHIQDADKLIAQQHGNCHVGLRIGQQRVGLKVGALRYIVDDDTFAPLYAERNQ